MDLSDYLKEAITKHLLGISAYSAPATIYVSLHTAAPSLTTGDNEVTGGSYARQAAAWEWDAVDVRGELNGAITFAGMPAVTVTHLGLWDASTAGNFLGRVAAAASKTVDAGDAIAVADNALTVVFE